MTSTDTAHVTAVQIAVGREVVNADLAVPASARGLIIFAHGSGRGRKSPRNQSVARTLEASGLATLLADLLTLKEEAADRVTAHRPLDIGLLARRLVALIEWVSQQKALRGLPIGVFGASTGAAAALVAAAALPYEILAVVSRGGRPDLACEALPHVTAPTLLIVGGADKEVIALNRWARARMRCRTSLEVVPGATHLFVEPGALEQVGSRAAAWFAEHLIAASREGSLPAGTVERHGPVLKRLG